MTSICSHDVPYRIPNSCTPFCHHSNATFAFDCVAFTLKDLFALRLVTEELTTSVLAAPCLKHLLHRLPIAVVPKPSQLLLPSLALLAFL